MSGSSQEIGRKGASTGPVPLVFITALLFALLFVAAASAENNTTPVLNAAANTTVTTAVATGTTVPETTVPPAPPVLKKPIISFLASPQSGAAPLTVTFYPVFNSSGGAPDYLVWDYGDGQKENRTLATSYDHTYVAAGTYSVSLVSANSAGSTLAEEKDFITVGIPAAATTAAPTTATAVPTTVATTVPPTTVTTVATTVPVTTTGTSATVTAGSDTNESGSLCRLPNQTIADFLATPSSGPAPLRVSFTDNSSCAGPVEWTWDFGTVTNPGIKTMRDPVVTYTEPGNYTVTLAVKNRLGGNSSVTKKSVIRVTAPVTKTPYPTATPTKTATVPTVPDFVANVTSGDAPLTVKFTDTSTGSPAAAWSWDFGDGGNGTDKNPVHTYRNAGTYTVVLRAGPGENAPVKVKENYIQVKASSNAIPAMPIVIVAAIVVVGVAAALVLRGRKPKGGAGGSAAQEAPRTPGRRGGRDL